MRKFTKSISALAFFGAVLLFTSCKDDSYLNDPKAAPDQSFVEEFDDYSAVISNGWKPINRSIPIGGTNWKLGSPNFAAYSSNIANTGCFYSDFNASGTVPTTSPIVATINNWLISKPLIVKDGDKIVFFTRTSAQAAGAEYPDRLQVRVNQYNDGLLIGRIGGLNPDLDEKTVGDFTIKLLDINRNLVAGGVLSYPRTWTKFTATVSGMPKAQMSRFAIRHFVANGGPANPNGTDVAIDSLAFISAK
jgi:hypothetical protein